MNVDMVAKLLAILAVPQIVWAGALAGPMLELAADRDALYTPGSIRLTFHLTPAAALAGPYDLRITVYTGQNMVREQMMTVTRARPVSYDVPFPRVREITRGSYRAELSLGGELLEVQERPLALWPPRDLQPAMPCHGKVWAFDTSGALQTLLPQFGLQPADASFQTVRDFGSPDLVFVGETLDRMNMQTLLQRMAGTSKAQVVILLRQKQFPKEFDAAISEKADPCRPVVRKPNSPLLKDLGGADVIQLLHDANAVKVEKHVGRSIHSDLTPAREDAQAGTSYLCVVEDKPRVLLFCQLPAVAPDDPRQMTLLHNLIQFACQAADRADSNRQTQMEREEP
jgi:hypothetical protein